MDNLKTGDLVRLTDCYLNSWIDASGELHRAFGLIEEMDFGGDDKFGIAAVRWNTSRMPRFFGVLFLEKMD